MVTAGEFLKDYLNKTKLIDKYVEIKRGACSIFTTIETFLRCYNEYDYYYDGNVQCWNDTPKLLSITLLR